jgi:hypothetical protein
MPQLDDDDRIRARVVRCRNANLLCAGPKIESRIEKLWLTPPRMIRSAMAAGIIIILLGIGVGTLLAAPR